MNHHMLVSIVYGHADRPKNLQPRLEAWLLFRAPDVQGFAIDVLHDEIRKPLRSRAAIEQPRDILMLELRQDLPLQPKARDDLLRVISPADQFDGDLLAILG